MISREGLSSAVQAGILTTEQADQLARHLASGGATPAAALDIDPPAEERIRFVGGFNDFFVAIGIAIVFFAILSGGTYKDYPVLTLLGCAGVAWALSEVFVLRMRTTLPGRILAAIFVTSVAIAALYFLPGPAGSLRRSKDIGALALFLGGTGGVLAAWLYFHRFRVPAVISLGMASAMLIAAAGLVAIAPTFVDKNIWLLMGVFGLIIFGVAMMFDLRDPQRVTWQNDAAFWLHILAAPMIVHPAVFELAGGPTMLNNGSPAVILLLAALFTLVALIIDRRALIVSALVYVGGALIYYASGVSGGYALALLALGAAVLLLSAGWRTFRRAVLAILPLGSLKARLPNLP